MNIQDACELIESVFTFDDVGIAMMALRKDLDNEELQRKLAADLTEAALEHTEGASEADKELLKSAAAERVAQYVAGSKSTRGTGCGR